MNRISTIQGHGQPGCRRADRGGAAADSMAALLKRVFIFIALMLTTASGAWAANETLLTTITPDGSGNPVYSVADIATIAKNGTSYSSSYGWYAMNPCYLTVTACEGIVITKVRFTTNGGATWEDTAAPFQVKLQGFYVYYSDRDLLNGDGVSRIDVYGYEAPTYSVALADGTEDADQWQAKVGTNGEFKVLPVTGIEGNQVTIQYNGTRHIKSVTAVQTAPEEEEIEAKGTDLSLLDNAGNAREKMWTANCYMVHTAGDYKLPLVYGNAIKDGETNAAAYTGVSNNSNATATFPRHDGSAITAPWIKDNGFTVAKAELLWQDAQGLVTEVGITGHYLTLTIGKNATEQEGNAIVAAELEDGTIVWSWHIWVTKETYENLETVNTGNHEYQVTPTNLGWVTTDLAQHKGYSTYYQWGRKDAFIPGDGETYSGVGANHKAYDINNQEVTGFLFEKSTTITTADNIKHPTTFYQDTQASGPNNTKYYNMWDAQQTGVGNIATATVKTVYDPCPVGFCVPTSNLYYFMEPKGDRTADDNWNNGKIFSNTFYPACGLRTGGTNAGKVTYAGNSGYYWSASASGSTSGYRIYFDAGYWYSGGVSRLMGQSIRPVAEE